MGWCSGTELFDAVVDIIDKCTGEDPVLTFDEGMEKLVLAFQQHDWDCESDSEYWEALVKPAMYRLGQFDDQD